VIMTGGRPFITTSADLAVLCTQACRSSEAVDVEPSLALMAGAPA
jgi:hypothetical protein